jgi:hypothetical protein
MKAAIDAHWMAVRRAAFADAREVIDELDRKPLSPMYPCPIILTEPSNQA